MALAGIFVAPTLFLGMLGRASFPVLMSLAVAGFVLGPLVERAARDLSNQVTNHCISYLNE
jgi:hypothetical protein